MSIGIHSKVYVCNSKLHVSSKLKPASLSIGSQDARDATQARKCEDAKRVLAEWGVDYKANFKNSLKDVVEGILKKDEVYGKNKDSYQSSAECELCKLIESYQKYVSHLRLSNNSDNIKLGVVQDLYIRPLHNLGIN
jgi:hypothetical protein